MLATRLWYRGPTTSDTNVNCKVQIQFSFSCKLWLGLMCLSCFDLELFDNYDPEIGFGGAHGRGRRKQDPPIERELYLTLEEVFKGCTKKMKISRRVSLLTDS